MKKKITAALTVCALLLCAFGLTACAERSVRGGGGTAHTGGFKLSSDMFDGYAADISGGKSAGIRVDGGKNYFVVFDENNAFSKVVFKRTETSFKGEIEQSEIKGQVDKMYIAGDFVFLCFTSGEIDPNARKYNVDYDKTDYRSGADHQSFAVYRPTGKVYSMAELETFSIVNEKVVKSGENYYTFEVSDGDIRFTDLVPNKNIMVSRVDIDNYGTMFVRNDTTVETKGKTIFYTSHDLSLGSDGYMYVFESGTLKTYDSRMQRTTVPVTRNLSFGEYDKWIVRGRFLFRVSGSSVDVSYLPVGKSMFEYWAGFPNNSEYFVLGPELFGLKEGADGAPAIYYYDLDTINTPNVEEYYGYFNLTGELIPPNQQLIVKATSAELRGGSIYTTAETVAGTKKYRVYMENGEIKTELLSDVGYEQIILTVQPLN